MSPPEVPHSFPAVDAVNAAQPMRNHDLRTVVEHAQDQLMLLMREPQLIAQRIAVIKRTINGLALLYAAELPCWPTNRATSGRKRGLTNACRIVLTRTDTSLSSREIYAILKEEFPDLVRQPGNHYASLVAILTRLVKYGEATFLRNGSRIWQRPQSVDRRSA
jgi:hypothetical protein